MPSPSPVEDHALTQASARFQCDARPSRRARLAPNFRSSAHGDAP